MYKLANESVTTRPIKELTYQGRQVINDIEENTKVCLFTQKQKTNCR